MNRLQQLSVDQRGIVLVMALMLMGLMAALASAYAVMVRSDTILRGAAGQDRTAFYAAEAGLNKGMAEFGTLFSNYQLPTSADFNVKQTSFNTRTVNYQLSPVVEYDPCPAGTNNEDCFTKIPAGEKFAGLNTIPYVYRVRSTALNSQSEKEAELGGEFYVHNIPIFQFIAFFSNDLEIQPAASMTLAGRVHTNGDLYLGPSGGTTTIQDQPPGITTVQVSAKGRIYRKRKETGSCDDGEVAITPLIDSNHDNLLDGPPLSMSCPGSSYITSSTIAAYQGAVTDQDTSITVPQPGIIDRGVGNLYWDRADLRIVLRLDQSRSSIAFNAADLCPGNANIPASVASPALYQIEVQNADGTQNTTKTRMLWRFMCERRGAIFYNDVPTVTASPQVRTSYTPNFSADATVYRRVGEDTNGDGIVDYNRTGGVTNSDRNYDVCPNSTAAATAASKPWWALDDCRWPYYSGISTSGGTAPFPASSWYQDMDYRRGGFLNKRENKWMYLLNINVRALIDWNESQASSNQLFSPSDTTDGGLIFHLSVQGPNSSSTANNYGVRVFDSADLNSRNGTFIPGTADPTGLTIVTDQAVYVEGNYNSYNWAPAAIMADSINVLSQGWEVPVGGFANDYKSAQTLTSNNRDVPATDANSSGACGGGLGCGSFSGTSSLWINTAFIGGVDNTTPGGGSNQYGGGLQNYPRMHEDWTGKTLNYLGSFVSLGPPRHVNGIWCCNGDSYDRYNPPVRNWTYDPRFETVQNLPPLTPKFTYVQQRMYTRFYQ